MKIQYVSDLHLEFEPIELVNKDSTDLLILAGDIITTRNINQYDYFFDNCSRNWKHVVYIAGNHEFYRGDLEETHDVLREYTSKWDNIYYLNNDGVNLPECEILGATLWTDCNGNDPITKMTIAGGMNDYRLISLKSKKHWKIWPEDTMALHRETKSCLKYFFEYAEEQGKQTIVVTHHAPSRQSTHPKYVEDYHMNGGYSSNLTPLILDYQPKLWIHGHTHNSFDYMVGNTRVLCNPRGYVSGGVAENSEFDLNKEVTFD